MSQFRKKPVVIEAMTVPESGDARGWGELAGFLSAGRVQWNLVQSPLGVEIHTLEGTMRGDVGDWIIRGVKGEFYPCKPDIFAVTYDKL